MVGVGVAKSAKAIYLVGHGVAVDEEMQLDRHVTLVPDFPRFVEEPDIEGSYLTIACLKFMDSVAHSALRVSKCRTKKELIGCAWNHLWTFKLVSLACRTPYFPLFSISEGPRETKCVSSNRYGIFPAMPEPHIMTAAEKNWIDENGVGFSTVMADDSFKHSARYLTNSFFIRDPEAQLMLIWAGIERLLGTESELRHRIAVNATLLSSLSEEEGLKLFKSVKSAYDFRSRVVHGAVADGKKIVEGLRAAETILYDLLRRCIELRRVPAAAELERLSLAGRFSKDA